MFLNEECTFKKERNGGEKEKADTHYFPLMKKKLESSKT